MNRLFLFLAIFSFALEIHSQSLYVEYEQITNVVKEVGSFKRHSILLVDNKISHFTTYFNNEAFKNVSRVKHEESDDLNVGVFSKVDVGNQSTLIYNKSNGSISQNLLDKGKPTIITDNGVKLEWQITEETKVIQSFTCTKATVYFRGRHFEAWFTPDIPVSYGPWKFHGLPGLILQIYDVDNLFIWNATKIEYPVKLDKKLESVHSGNKFVIKSLKEYMDEQVTRRDDEERIRRSKLPKGSKLVESKTENNSLELVYEWELEDDKKH